MFKAFDLVDHEILLYKLKLYHFDDQACALFSSYLQKRTQIVKAENTVSENMNIISGVPQRSILGPMLFIIYVNDVSMHLTCNTELYADDTTLHESANCLSTI